MIFFPALFPPLFSLACIAKKQSCKISIGFEILQLAIRPFWNLKNT